PSHPLPPRRPPDPLPEPIPPARGGYLRTRPPGPGSRPDWPAPPPAASGPSLAGVLSRRGDDCRPEPRPLEPQRPPEAPTRTLRTTRREFQGAGPRSGAVPGRPGTGGGRPLRCPPARHSHALAVGELGPEDIHPPGDARRPRQTAQDPDLARLRPGARRGDHIGLPSAALRAHLGHPGHHPRPHMAGSRPASDPSGA